ncbi:hypothetical protein [Actinophytocola sediminis]
MSLLLVAPISAQATTACGATAEQWVGSFDGDHIRSWSTPIPLSVEVTQDATGALQVATDVDGVGHPMTHVDIVLDRLHWIVERPEDLFFPLRKYGANPGEVTCSGDVVTSFSGYVLDFLPGYGEVTFSDFELVRVN